MPATASRDSIAAACGTSLWQQPSAHRQATRVSAFLGSTAARHCLTDGSTARDHEPTCTRLRGRLLLAECHSAGLRLSLRNSIRGRSVCANRNALARDVHNFKHTVTPLRDDRSSALHRAEHGGGPNQWWQSLLWAARAGDFQHLDDCVLRGNAQCIHEWHDATTPDQ
jgi:hypothetical protein